MCWDEWLPLEPEVGRGEGVGRGGGERDGEEKWRSAVDSEHVESHLKSIAGSTSNTYLCIQETQGGVDLHLR